MRSSSWTLSNVLLGRLSNDEGENGKKTIGFIGKGTTLHVHHAFLYISLPSLHGYDVKMSNFTFCGGREHNTTTFFLFSWPSIQSVRIQPQKKWPIFDERQKSHRLRSVKQQLCAYITLFCTFLCRHCTATTWKCLISRFVEDVNTTQRLSFYFPDLR